MPADAAPAAGFNGGFESWSNGRPAGWSAVGVTISEATAGTLSGSGVSVTASGALGQFQHMAIGIDPGAIVSASVQLSGDAAAQAGIELAFLDDGLLPLSESAGMSRPATSAFSPVSHQATADSRAAYVQFRILVRGPGELLLDNATLDVQPPPPTTVPTPTPTTEASPTATSSAQATATSAGGTDPTPTRSATPTRTPTGTRTATATREPTSTRTPTPRPEARRSPTLPLATSTPTVRAGSSSGGMLANGDFEVVSDGKPAHWEKFGGTLFASSEAAGGSYAACLESDTSSTKWLYQVVPVQGGSWYAGEAMGRVAGGGDALIRVSWYESSDGSGGQMEQSESSSTNAAGWTSLATGSVQAPEDAQSARVRLVVRPAGTMTGCFDDAVFGQSSAPAVIATPAPPTGTAAPATATRPNATVRATSTPRPATGPSGSSRGVSGPDVQAVGELQVGPLSLRISEFMSDPPQAGRDAEYEWMELVNIGSEAVDLSGWALGDGTSSSVFGPLLVPAGGYVIVSGPLASIPAGVANATTESGQIGNGLGNDGDLLRLTAPDGQVVDEVSYGDNVKVFDPAPSAPDAGQTLGLIDPAADPASENWAISLRATPGEPNAFPPLSASTVAGARQLPPGATIAADNQEDGPTVVEDDGDGGSVAPWMILGGLAGISAGIAGAALWPRLKPKYQKLRARFRKE